jgi:hypothetical protein
LNYFKYLFILSIATPAASAAPWLRNAPPSEKPVHQRREVDRIFLAESFPSGSFPEIIICAAYGVINFVPFCRFAMTGNGIREIAVTYSFHLVARSALFRGYFLFVGAA